MFLSYTLNSITRIHRSEIGVDFLEHAVETLLVLAGEVVVAAFGFGQASQLGAGVPLRVVIYSI